MGNRMYILDNGYMELDENQMIALSVMGLTNDKHPQCRWMQIPVYCILIHNDEAGWILFDTGCNPNCSNASPDEPVCRYFFNDDQRLENQLAKVGLKPSDINIVVASHMHVDHGGGFYLFTDTDAECYVNGDEFAYTLKKVFQSQNPADWAGTERNDLIVPIKKWNFLPNEDYEIAPGVKLLYLPGHSFGLMGLQLTLDSGTILYPVDTCNTHINYGPPARLSGIVYDSIAMMNSIEKVRRIEKATHAKVIFPHDMELFKQFKLAPEYYE